MLCVLTSWAVCVEWCGICDIFGAGFESVLWLFPGGKLQKLSMRVPNQTPEVRYFFAVFAWLLQSMFQTRYFCSACLTPEVHVPNQIFAVLACMHIDGEKCVCGGGGGGGGGAVLCRKNKQVTDCWDVTSRSRRPCADYDWSWTNTWSAVIWLWCLMWNLWCRFLSQFYGFFQAARIQSEGSSWSPCSRPDISALWWWRMNRQLKYAAPSRYRHCVFGERERSTHWDFGERKRKVPLYKKRFVQEFSLLLFCFVLLRKKETDK